MANIKLKSDNSQCYPVTQDERKEALSHTDANSWVQMWTAAKFLEKQSINLY